MSIRPYPRLRNLWMTPNGRLRVPSWTAPILNLVKSGRNHQVFGFEVFWAQLYVLPTFNSRVFDHREKEIADVDIFGLGNMCWFPYLKLFTSNHQKKLRMDEEGNYKWRLGLLMVEAFTVPTKLSGFFWQLVICYWL